MIVHVSKVCHFPAPPPPPKIHRSESSRILTTAMRVRIKIFWNQFMLGFVLPFLEIYMYGCQVA